MVERVVLMLGLKYQCRNTKLERYVYFKVLLCRQRMKSWCWLIQRHTCGTLMAHPKAMSGRSVTTTTRLPHPSPPGRQQAALCRYPATSPTSMPLQGRLAPSSNRTHFPCTCRPRRFAKVHKRLQERQSRPQNSTSSGRGLP